MIATVATAIRIELKLDYRRRDGSSITANGSAWKNCKALQCDTTSVSPVAPLPYPVHSRVWSVEGGRGRGGVASLRSLCSKLFCGSRSLSSPCFWSRSRLLDRRADGGWSDSLPSLQHSNCKPRCTLVHRGITRDLAHLLYPALMSAYAARLHATPASGPRFPILASSLARVLGNIMPAMLICKALL